MGPALMAAALQVALQVALLPAEIPENNGVPAEAVKAGAQALQRSLPAPWAELKLEKAALEGRLAAAGPACRVDLVCLCSVAPFEDGALALDLRVSSLAPLKGCRSICAWPSRAPGRWSTAAAWWWRPRRPRSRASSRRRRDSSCAAATCRASAGRGRRG